MADLDSIIINTIADALDGFGDNVHKLAKLIRHGENSEKKGVKIQNTKYSKDEEMLHLLKMQLSIPLDSQNYPNNLTSFLEKIWNENVSNAEKSTWQNTLLEQKSNLESLKEGAVQKRKVRIQQILDFIKSDLGI